MYSLVFRDIYLLMMWMRKLAFYLNNIYIPWRRGSPAEKMRFGFTLLMDLMVMSWEHDWCSPGSPMIQRTCNMWRQWVTFLMCWVFTQWLLANMALRLVNSKWSTWSFTYLHVVSNFLLSVEHKRFLVHTRTLDGDLYSHLTKSIIKRTVVLYAIL